MPKPLDLGTTTFPSARVSASPWDRGQARAGLVALKGSLTFGTGEPWADPFVYDFLDAKRVVVEGEGLFPIRSASEGVGWSFFEGVPHGRVHLPLEITLVPQVARAIQIQHRALRGRALR